MEKLIIKTKKTKEIVDITDRINNLIKNHMVKDGICYLFLMHTTAGLTTAYLDPESELSIIDAFQVTMPVSIASEHKEYKHEHTHITTHIPDHIIASFLGPSLSIPIQNNNLMLGKLQRVALVELNGPKKREILIKFE